MEIFRYYLLGFNLNVLLGVLFRGFNLYRFGLFLAIQFIILVYLDYQKGDKNFSTSIVVSSYALLSFLVGVLL